MHFKGEYKNDNPFTGEIKIADNEPFKESYGFKGTIKDGKLINGIGYSKHNVYVDLDYVYANEDDADCRRYISADMKYADEYYEQQDDIPDNVKQEWIEDDIRNEVRNSKEVLQDICIEVDELLQTKWEDGKAKKEKDDDLYKKYIGYGRKK